MQKYVRPGRHICGLNPDPEDTAAACHTVFMTDTLLPELQTPEARRAVAELLLALFRRWALHESKQAELLAMDNIEALQRGEPLPENHETLERAGLILAIDRSLQQRYPEDHETRDIWVVYPNSALGGLSPLTVMLGGLEGIRRIRRMLSREDTEGSPPEKGDS